jgi:hypothetical protein
MKLLIQTDAVVDGIETPSPPWRLIWLNLYQASACSSEIPQALSAGLSLLAFLKHTNIFKLDTYWKKEKGKTENKMERRRT